MTELTVFSYRTLKVRDGKGARKNLKKCPASKEPQRRLTALSLTGFTPFAARWS